MKKYIAVFMAIILVMCLAACGATDAEAEEGKNTAGTEKQGGPDTTVSVTGDIQDEGEGDVHTPASSGTDNILPHDSFGYCGNAVTTIKFDGMGTEEKWEKSFWGGESVRMTDLLRFLDYSEGVCRCMPEYTVDTEFGDGYGINLSESYVRHDGHQVTLTEEQTAELREIIEWAAEQE